jgi:hypothetical protein
MSNPTTPPQRTVECSNADRYQKLFTDVKNKMGKKEFDPPFVFEVDPKLNIDFDFNNPMYRSIVTLNAMNAQDALRDSEKQVARRMGDRLTALIDALANQYNGTEAVLKQYKQVLNLDTKAAHYQPIGEPEWWWEDAEIQDIVVKYILKPISSQGDTAIRRAIEEGEEEQEEYRRLDDDMEERIYAGSSRVSGGKGGPGTTAASRQSHSGNDSKDESAATAASTNQSRNESWSQRLFRSGKTPDSKDSTSVVSKLFLLVCGKRPESAAGTSLSPPSSNAERKGLS